MSVLPKFVLQKPSTLEAALGAISADDMPYSGGTELLLAMRAGLLRPFSLVDLKGIPELAMLTRSKDQLRIGGGVTYRTLINNRQVTSDLPILRKVMESVGNPRIRAAGTLGGNLCFAEPKSDVATILIALGAAVTLTASDRRRVVAVDDFVLGPYATTRAEDELLELIEVPLVSGRRVAYERFQIMERPTASVALVVAPEGVHRVVVGAVGGRPQTFLSKSRAELDVSEVAARIEVMPDLLGSDRYKRHVVRSLIAGALDHLAAQP